MGCCGRSPLARHRCPRDGITSRRAKADTGDEVRLLEQARCPIVRPSFRQPSAYPRASFCTYGFQPLEGAPFYSDELARRNQRIKTKNKLRRIGQSIGLVLLFLSFAVQIVAVLWPGLFRVFL